MTLFGIIGINNAFMTRIISFAQCIDLFKGQIRRYIASFFPQIGYIWKYFIANIKFHLYLFFKQTQSFLKLMRILSSIIQLTFCYLQITDHVGDFQLKKLNGRLYPKLFNMFVLHGLLLVLCSLPTMLDHLILAYNNFTI